MSSSDFRVMAPDRQQHAEAVVELCARTFGRYYSFRNDLRNWYLLNSHYDWDCSAAGWMGANMVTHYGVWDYAMRIGSAVVRCGGIGCVATDGDYRKQGLMARTIPTSLDAMRRTGYDLSILFGAWDFYHRFGYVRAWNEETWIMDRDRIPEGLPAVKTEAFDGAPREDVARLHNRVNATVTGSAVRPTFARHGFTFSPVEGRLWKDARGRLAGHVVVNSDNGPRLSCIESTGKVEEILSVLKQWATEKQCREVAFQTAPYDSPVIRRVRQLTCRLERSYVKSGSAMVQCHNLRACLQKMSGELSRRLGSSELADYRGDLAIVSGGETVALGLNHGVVKLVEKADRRNSLRAGQEIAQLLIGTDEPMESCEAGKMRLTGDAARLVPVLFPNQHPQLQELDRY